MPNTLSFPEENESTEYFKRYINRVPPDEGIQSFLKSQELRGIVFLNSIPDEKANYRYAEGKWSVKEVLQHIIDTEKIFTYRALALARGEKQALPGYDQDEYMLGLNIDEVPLSQLVQDFLSTRKATVSFFNSIGDEHAAYAGTVSGGNLSARACAYIIGGHFEHHEEVLKERYL